MTAIPGVRTLPSGLTATIEIAAGPSTGAVRKPPWYRSLFLQLLVAIVAGILVGKLAAVALLLGADRLMDSMRVTVNLLGNCVDTFGREVGGAAG
jgi:hypothetical protein